jgi:hypothetical protein
MVVSACFATVRRFAWDLAMARAAARLRRPQSQLMTLSRTLAGAVVSPSGMVSIVIVLKICFQADV